jgi:hypothetical protein
MISAFVFFQHALVGQELIAKSSDSIILIGEQIVVEYQVVSNDKPSIKFDPFEDKLPASQSSDSSQLSSNPAEFEIISFSDTTIHSSKKRFTWTAKYTVTIWDSGVFIIPGPSIIVDDSTLKFNSLEIKTLFSKQIKGVDIYDIKENYAEVPDRPFSFISFLKSHWWWMTLILLAGLVFLIIKRRKNMVEDEVNSMSLKERTIFAINALEEAKLWEKHKLKEHFVELSYIIRRYLANRYEISLMEMTSDQIKYALLRKGLEMETVQVISQILGASDMVKFAKSKPEIIEILKVSALAKQVVAETSPLDFDNVD